MSRLQNHPRKRHNN